MFTFCILSNDKFWQEKIKELFLLEKNNKFYRLNVFMENIVLLFFFFPFCYIIFDKLASVVSLAALFFHFLYFLMMNFIEANRCSVIMSIMRIVWVFIVLFIPFFPYNPRCSPMVLFSTLIRNSSIFFLSVECFCTI